MEPTTRYVRCRAGPWHRRGPLAPVTGATEFTSAIAWGILAGLQQGLAARAAQPALKIAQRDRRGGSAAASPRRESRRVAQVEGLDGGGAAPNARH